MFSNSRLELVVMPRDFDRAEEEALQVASGCGGVLYRRVGAAGGAWVAALPESMCGRRVVMAQESSTTQAIAMAREEQIRSVVVMSDASAARVEVRPDGVRLWVVPRDRIAEYSEQRAAGAAPARLLDFAFGMRS